MRTYYLNGERFECKGECTETEMMDYLWHTINDYLVRIPSDSKMDSEYQDVISAIQLFVDKYCC